MKRKILKVGDNYQMMNEEENGTISVKDAVSFLSLALFEDVCEYRKGKTELEKRIGIEVNALSSLAASLKSIT